MPRVELPRGPGRRTCAGGPALKKQHAEEVAGILADVGYDDDTIDRVQRIIRKEGLGTDPAVQVHEDALCLVFLETQLAATVDHLGDEQDGRRHPQDRREDERTGPSAWWRPADASATIGRLIGRALARR